MKLNWLPLYFLLLTCSLIAQEKSSVTNPDLKLAKKHSEELELLTPLEKDIQDFQPFSDRSLDEKVSGRNRFLQYEFIIIQNNNLAQVNVNNEYVLKGAFKSKQYLTFLNDTPFNPNNVYGKGLYLAPSMSFGSGNENVSYAELQRINFVRSTLDFGYELKTLNYNMDFFAGAGLSYNSIYLPSDNLIIVKTGLIIKL